MCRDQHNVTTRKNAIRINKPAETWILAQTHQMSREAMNSTK